MTRVDNKRLTDLSAEVGLIPSVAAWRIQLSILSSQQNGIHSRTPLILHPVMSRKHSSTMKVAQLHVRSISVWKSASSRAAGQWQSRTKLPIPQCIFCLQILWSR